MKKKFKIVLLTLTILTMLFAVSCKKADENAVATVNGKAISEKEFTENYKVYERMYKQQLGEEALKKTDKDGVSFKDKLKENILEKLIVDELINQEIDNKKIAITDEEVNNLYEQTIKDMGGQEQYEEFLKQQNITDDFIKDSIKKDYKQQKLEEAFYKDNKVTEEEIKDFYDANKDRLIKYSLSQIMADNEEDAKKLYDKLEAGEDFAELAKNESSDTYSAANGGNMGEVQASTMPEEFLNAVSATEIGSYSKVFKSDMGYHIVKVDDKKDQLEDLRTEIEQTLKSQKFIEYMKNLRANADVKKMDLPEIKDEDVKTNEEDKDSETKEDSKDSETPDEGEAEDKSDNK
ncbi:MAG: peptidylprolyl isomerase [Eubacteriales bacterium]|uniref:peptidylprolyl isomerase n=1 Tax=Fenollaria sp. TaxID=1965292 RepID=UPI002A765205|nr:peptidylprolyl isomerase [Fenollaria sp.]MDD7340125.1 peptidylprolyl isomerase [Eubacteriales bacterium]MDY3105549.1 peptidylprolyl isomerase [Fenollaria sp.]